jgi:N-acetylglucosamine-6-phosphate deacetylase
VGDGHFELGGLAVDVADGQACLSGTDVLAGSTLTMAGAVRNAVTLLGLDVPTAVRMATSVPAGLLGAAAGEIVADGRADLVRLGPKAELRATYVGGQRVPATVERTPQLIEATS